MRNWLLALLVFSLNGIAQDYPSKLIHLIVPVAAGGNLELTATASPEDLSSYVKSEEAGLKAH